jgi:hypothetical protein
MKMTLFALLLTFSAMGGPLSLTITGNVSADKECSSKAMVWLSLDREEYKERLLLMHTEVPKGGTFSFFVRPGNYQIRASDMAGCEYLEKVSVKSEDSILSVRLVKK